jgi:hypothetical protein
MICFYAIRENHKRFGRVAQQINNHGKVSFYLLLVMFYKEALNILGCTPFLGEKDGENAQKEINCSQHGESITLGNCGQPNC